MPNTDASGVSNLLLDIAFTFERIKREIKHFGTDQYLHGAEIGMIAAIHEDEGIHVTGLAQKMGITKGAVSQTLKKLERKGMIVKETDELNQSRLVLRLTEKGMVACRNHEQMHQKFKEAVTDLLKSAGNDRLDFLTDFLSAFARGLHEYEKGNK